MGIRLWPTITPMEEDGIVLTTGDGPIFNGIVVVGTGMFDLKVG